MKKFSEWSLTTQAICIYLLVIVLSLFIAPLSGRFYLQYYKPNLLASGFLINSAELEIYFGGFFVAYFVLSSLFAFSLIRRKQLLIWFIGAIVPIILSLLNGIRYTFWAIVLSLAGWLLAQVIVVLKNKKN